VSLWSWNVSIGFYRLSDRISLPIVHLIMEGFAVLPWEIGRQCLLRVPYDSHENLRAVCKSCEAAVNHPQFYEDRKKFGILQRCICLVELREYPAYPGDDLEFVVSIFDPLRGTRETLPPLPHFPGSHNGIPLFCDCVCVNRKLVLMAGWNPSDLCLAEALNTVFIYDFSSGKWSRGADMPQIRISGAFSVSPEGLLYVAGGHDDYEDFLRSAAVYNVFEDKWKIPPEMREERDECYGAFIDGKFFVISGYNCESVDRFKWSAEVYDPERGAWTTLENMWTVGEGEGKGPQSCVVAASSGRLYSFQKQQGVMEYDSGENVWSAVGSLPETLIRISCCVAWRDKIFVCGYAESNGEVFYLFEPPRTISAAIPPAETSGMWTATEKPEKSHVEYVQCIQSAFTFEI